MRVLLVSANQERSPDPVAPLGACYVATAAAGAGHEVHVLDLCFSDDPPAAVRAAVAAHRPEAIGISLRNVDNCAYPDTVSYLPHYHAVVEACRAASPAPIVLGGSAFTTMPAFYLAALEVPYGVVGEGEVALPALLARLVAGSDARGVGGVAVWDAVTRAVTVTPPAWLPSLDALSAELLDLMMAAGCQSIDFGTDAGSNRTLRAFRKSFNVDDIHAASALCRERGLPFCHSLVFGGEDETWETVAETIATMDACRPTAVTAMCGVRVYPETPFAQALIARGEVPGVEALYEPYFHLSPAVRAGR